MPRKHRIDFDEVLLGNIVTAVGEQLEIISMLTEELSQLFVRLVGFLQQTLVNDVTNIRCGRLSGGRSHPMRRPLILISVLVAFATAAPADAQIVGRRTYDAVPPVNRFLPDSRLPGAGIGRQLTDVRDRIERARDNGWLSRREARRLDREARLIGLLAHRYGRDGLSSSERAELESRTSSLRDAVNRPQPGAGF